MNHDTIRDEVNRLMRRRLSPDEIDAAIEAAWERLRIYEYAMGGNEAERIRRLLEVKPCD